MRAVGQQCVTRVWWVRDRGGDPDAALHTRGLVGDNQARRRLHTATVSERSGGRALDHGSPPMAHRQYSLEILEYSRGQLPHHRRQTKQDQHPDQSRPYIQPALRHNFSGHQPIHLPDAAILGKPGATGRISSASNRVRCFRSSLKISRRRCHNAVEREKERRRRWEDHSRHRSLLRLGPLGECQTRFDPTRCKSAKRHDRRAHSCLAAYLAGQSFLDDFVGHSDGVFDEIPNPGKLSRGRL